MKEAFIIYVFLVAVCIIMLVCSMIYEYVTYQIKPSMPSPMEWFVGTCAVLIPVVGIVCIAHVWRVEYKINRSIR